MANLSAVRYGQRFGFLGLYVTAPDTRGRGYGLTVWRAGRARLEGRVVGLDAIPEQEKTYARDGFVTNHRTTRHMLAAWLAMPDAASRAVINVDQVLGWALRRPCLQGHKVGPLFANDPEIADDLLCALAAGVDGPLYLDIPDPNTAGRELAVRHGMTPVFTTVRMYDGPPPELDLDRIFGVTTLELG